MAAVNRSARKAAQRHSRQPDALAGESRYVVVGAIASDAPAPGLLAALQALRPGCDVRLDPAGASRLGRHYAVALRARPRRAAQAHAIDAWLRIKSALMAAFPRDKPGAVTPLDETDPRPAQRSRVKPNSAASG